MSWYDKQWHKDRLRVEAITEWIIQQYLQTLTFQEILDFMRRTFPWPEQTPNPQDHYPQETRPVKAVRVLHWQPWLLDVEIRVWVGEDLDPYIILDQPHSTVEQGEKLGHWWIKEPPVGA